MPTRRVSAALNVNHGRRVDGSGRGLLVSRPFLPQFSQSNDEAPTERHSGRAPNQMPAVHSRAALPPSWPGDCLPSRSRLSSSLQGAAARPNVTILSRGVPSMAITPRRRTPLVARPVTASPVRVAKWRLSPRSTGGWSARGWGAHDPGALRAGQRVLRWRLLRSRRLR